MSFVAHSASGTERPLFRTYYNKHALRAISFAISIEQEYKIHILTKLIAWSMQYFRFRFVPKLESAFMFGFDDFDNCVDCESKGFIIRRVSM